VPISKEFIGLDLKYYNHNDHPIPVVISRVEGSRFTIQKEI